MEPLEKGAASLIVIVHKAQKWYVCKKKGAQMAAVPPSEGRAMAPFWVSSQSSGCFTEFSITPSTSVQPTKVRESGIPWLRKRPYWHA